MKIQSLNKIIFAYLLYWTSVLSFFHLFHSFLVIIQRRDFIGWLNEITWNHKKERMVGSEFDWRLRFFSFSHTPSTILTSITTSNTVFTRVTCSIFGRETQVYPCLVAKAKLLEKSRFEVNTQVSCSWQRNATLPCQVMIAKLLKTCILN